MMLDYFTYREIVFVIILDADLGVLGWLAYRILLRVSRVWNSSLKASKQLWTHVDLACSSAKLTWQNVTSCANRARGAMKTLEFRNLPRADSMQKLCSIFERSPQLEELILWAGKQTAFNISRSISRATALKKIFIGDLSIPYRDVILILVARPTLVHARFLSVYFYKSRPPKLSRKLSNLEHLAICRKGRMELDYGDSMLVIENPL